MTPEDRSSSAQHHLQGAFKGSGACQEDLACAPSGFDSELAAQIAWDDLLERLRNARLPQRFRKFLLAVDGYQTGEGWDQATIDEIVVGYLRRAGFAYEEIDRIYAFHPAGRRYRRLPVEDRMSYMREVASKVDAQLEMERSPRGRNFRVVHAERIEGPRGPIFKLRIRPADRPEIDVSLGIRELMSKSGFRRACGRQANFLPVLLETEDSRSAFERFVSGVLAMVRINAVASPEPDHAIEWSVRMLAGEHGYWRGTPTELLDALTAKHPSPPLGWPQTPESLHFALERLYPRLEATGIEVAFSREPGGNRRRLVLLRNRDARYARDKNSSCDRGT